MATLPETVVRVSGRVVGTPVALKECLLGLWFYIFSLGWLKDSFIHLSRFSQGVNSPPEVNETLLGIQSVCEATRVPFHCFAAAIYQMVPWWLREWVCICERASFTSRDALSESPHSVWTSQGWRWGRVAIAALLFPSHSHAGLLCQWKMSQGKLVKDRTQLLSTCHFHFVRVTSLGIFPGRGCPGSQMSRAFSRPQLQGDGPCFCPVLSFSLHQHIT